MQPSGPQKYPSLNIILQRLLFAFIICNGLITADDDGGGGGGGGWVHGPPVQVKVMVMGSSS